VYEIIPEGDDKVTEVLRKHANLTFESEPGVKKGTGALAQARRAKAMLKQLFGDWHQLPIYSESQDGREVRLVEE
jgi:hypothetical protein